MEKNTKNIIIIAAVFVVLIGLILGFYFFTKNVGTTKENSEKNNNLTTQVKKLQCGDLKADNNIVQGTAPFAPILRGKLSGSFDANKKICDWYIDDALGYSSFPVGEECVFGGNGLMTKGEHIISYKVSGVNGCQKSIKVVVQ